MANHFRVNRAGMSRITRTMGGDACESAAQRGLRWAQAHAPVETGEYRRSFEVESAEVTVSGQRRKGARLVNTSDHAWAVEWGTGGKHILARAADEIERG